MEKVIALVESEMAATERRLRYNQSRVEQLRSLLDTEAHAADRHDRRIVQLAEVLKVLRQFPTEDL